MAFPSGVSFSKETGFNRTPSENEALRVIRLFAGDFVGGRIQKKEKPEDFSFQVGSGVIESNIIIGITCLLELDIDEESHNDT